jgi:hypothetical protein
MHPQKTGAKFLMSSIVLALGTAHHHAPSMSIAVLHFPTLF